MTEFNTRAPFAAEQPSPIGAGAEIYRKLERGPRRSRMGYAVPLVAAAIAIAGGAGAYMMLRPSAAPLSATPVLQAAEAPPPQTLPAQQAEVPATPTPATAAPVAEPVRPLGRPEHPARLAAQSGRSRPHPRHAASAAASGEDANAYAPATPAPATTTAQPPAAFFSAPPPVTLPPPPAPPAANPVQAQPPA
jgi:hypothetical protein